MLLAVLGPLLVISTGAVLSRRVRSRNRHLVLASSVVAAIVVFAAIIARNPNTLM